MRGSSVSSTGIGRWSASWITSRRRHAAAPLEVVPLAEPLVAAARRNSHETDQEDQVDGCPWQEEDARQQPDDEIPERQTGVGRLVGDADAHDAQVGKRVAVDEGVAQALDEDEDRGQLDVGDVGRQLHADGTQELLTEDDEGGAEQEVVERRQQEEGAPVRRDLGTRVSVHALHLIAFWRRRKRRR